MTKLFKNRPTFVVAHDGHVFICNHRPAYTIVTNESGLATRVVWVYFKRIIGVK